MHESGHSSSLKFGAKHALRQRRTTDITQTYKQNGVLHRPRWCFSLVRYVNSGVATLHDAGHGVTRVAGPDARVVSRDSMSRTAQFISYGLTLLAWTLLVHGDAKSALPGRVETVDLVRLAQQDRGMIDGGGPSLDVASGAEGGFGFGPPTCDAERFTARPVIHPRSGLTVRVPRFAQTLELMIRSTFGSRELTLTLGGKPLTETKLTGEWQRVVAPLKGVESGDALLEIGLSTTVNEAQEASSVDASTRALIHRVTFDTRLNERRQTEELLTPRTASDVLWLEPGQSVLMPAPLQPNQALETSGVITVGEVNGLRIHVDLVSAYGAVKKLASMPAAMDMPWNLDLSRGGERTPVWMRLRCTGPGSSAAGMLMPRLTRKETPGEASASVDGGAPGLNTVIVIAVQGLRFEDAAASRGPKPKGVFHERAWSTSPDIRASLTSLMTGLSPVTHGVVGLRDEIPKEFMGLGRELRLAGVRTILRTGFIPMTAGSPLWEGFEDALFADLRRLNPHANHVLDATLKVLSHESTPTLALAVLGDPSPPFIPTTEAWKAHYDKPDDPPWPANESRKAVAEISTGERPFTDRNERYLRALRRGKAQETLAHIRAFQGAARAKHKDALIMVVGLGGVLPGETKSFRPEDVHVPLWIDSPNGWSPPSQITVDIMDVMVTATSHLSVSPRAGTQGTDLRRDLKDPWPTGALATQTRAESLDLVAWDDTVLMAQRGQINKRSIYLPEGNGWRLEKKAPPSKGPAIDTADALLRGWLSARARWNPETYEAAVRRGGEDGYADPCR